MFGIGFGEMLVIAVVVLIAVGPKKMPTFMKAVGKGLREFRHATRELKNAAGLDELLRDEDLRNPLAHKPKKHKPRPNYTLNDEDFRAERPIAGTDVSHAVAQPKDAQAHREAPAPAPVDDPVFASNDEAEPEPKAAPEAKTAPKAAPEAKAVSVPEPEPELVAAGDDQGGLGK
ncbi:MAG: twin-arginine translocase TatA/TatE family subunit [Deltaproteobacteria bacterium]|nr:twin-arginine translocase TatA/TatE family subunit [Deltaproteobacteria bacterium]